MKRFFLWIILGSTMDSIKQSWLIWKLSRPRPNPSLDQRTVGVVRGVGRPVGGAMEYPQCSSTETENLMLKSTMTRS